MGFKITDITFAKEVDPVGEELYKLKTVDEFISHISKFLEPYRIKEFNNYNLDKIRCGLERIVRYVKSVLSDCDFGEFLINIFPISIVVTGKTAIIQWFDFENEILIFYNETEEK